MGSAAQGQTSGAAARALSINTESFDGDESVQPGRRGAQRDAGASGKRRNAPDGRMRPTGGRLLAPAEHRYAPLVVNQTTARRMPCRQTPKAGQMAPYWIKVL